MIDAVTQTVDTWHQQFQQIMVHKDAILANLNLPLDAPRSVYYKPTLENYVDEFFDYILSSADIYNNSLKTYRQESNLTNPADINAQSIANFSGFRMSFTELKFNNFGQSYGQKSKKYLLVVHSCCRNPSTLCQ